jgi:hypothetical protein
MKTNSHLLKPILVLALAAFTVFSSAAVYAEDTPETGAYVVTIQNLTGGQPMSPPVAASHRKAIRMFRVGKMASPGLEAIAEDGNQGPMFTKFNMSPKVTEAVDVGMPLTPNGQMVGPFTDSVNFAITAKPGDRFSFATMLICTNDGFTGLDAVKLPKDGSAVYLTAGYDAGTENNTEMSADIVDACSALGPGPLAGDPNGNEDVAVDSMPHQPVAHHGNINGGGDLSVSAHGWTGPVAKVTITRVSANADEFRAGLSGAGEVGPVHTMATGIARFELEDGDSKVEYRLRVKNITGVVQAHIHYGSPNENGPVVAFLYGPSAPTGPVNGRLAKGDISEGDLLGPLAGDFAGFVQALQSGHLYVNVHTAAHPAGEIRGQIGADLD